MNTKMCNCALPAITGSFDCCKGCNPESTGRRVNESSPIQLDDAEQLKEWMTSVTVLWTCPKCGSALSSEVITTYPPIDVYRCYKCGWSHKRQNKFVFLPFPEEDAEQVSEERET